MTNIIERLRGKYEVGPNGSTGIRDFSTNFPIPPISLEAADYIECLEKRLNKITDIIYAVGAPLGSDNYFEIRNLAVMAEHQQRD